jgi:ATP-binding cassette subfamily B protein
MRTFVRPYYGYLILMTVAALAATLAGIVVPLVTRQVIDGPIRHGDRSAVWPLGGLALLFGMAEAVLVFLRRWTMSTSALGLETDVRNVLYRHLQRLPVAFHDRWQSGQLLSRATSDLSQIRRFIGFGLVFMVVNSATFVVVAALLMAIYWPLAVLVVLLSVPLVWVMYRFERLYRVRSRSVQDQQGELTTLVEESAGGIRTVKAFGRSRTVYGRYDEQARRMRDLEMGKIQLLALIWAIIEAHPSLVLAAIVPIGAVAVVHGVLTIGTLVAFVSLFLLLLWPIASMGWLLAAAQEAGTAADRVYEVLDSEMTITDRPDAEPVGRCEGRLRLEGVGFTYPGADHPVLHDIDLDIAPGETVALVGATGSGKTTLVALVPRLYDVTAGRITLDGRDIRDLPVASLREVVGTAFEEPTLFSASVRENLTLGRPDATEAEITEALSIAQAEFVYDLPWGLDTRVGEQGLTLSGGQRQRLALARAVLGRPRLLVLDDPLSALDVHTEALVEEALRRVLAGTTGLVVAHRASTVLLADRVALLVDGTIGAVGTHHDLLETVPEYRDLLSQEAELGVPH